VAVEYAQPAIPQQTVAVEYVQPQQAVQQIAVAQQAATFAQPTMAVEYAQPAMAVAQPIASYTTNPIESLNQAINMGEVKKPGRASEFYEMYKSVCQNIGVCATTFGAAQVVSAAPSAVAAIPQQSSMTTLVETAVPPTIVETMVPQPQAFAYAQPPAAVIQQVEQPLVNSYTPAPVYVEKAQAQNYSYAPPMVMAAPVSAMAAPVMAPVLAQGPESVVLDEVGEWMVCEDALGLFYYHSPTGQSHDQPPIELVQYYEMQGVQLAPTGAFGAQVMQAPMVVQQAPMMAAPAYHNYQVL
jgi:hypothetical protein